MSNGAAVLAVACATALSITGAIARASGGWDFPSWPETAVQVVWISGLLLVTYIGARWRTGREPSLADVGLDRPAASTLSTAVWVAVGGATVVSAVAVAHSFDAGGALLLATFLVRWPVSTLAQQTLFFGWLQPRLGAHNIHKTALLFIAFHVAMPMALVGAVPLGFLFAWLRSRTGSIHAGIAVHYLVNMWFVLAFN